MRPVLVISNEAFNRQLRHEVAEKVLRHLEFLDLMGLDEEP